MPKSMNEMEMYEDLLDKLSEDYPELGKEVEALSSKMMSMEPMDDMEDDMEEDPTMPSDIPADLMDDEEDEEMMMEEDEEEYSL